jgi:DNA-binding NarL/FixJ family response regulator
MRILVVDDHPLFNLGLSTALALAAEGTQGPALTVRSATSLIQGLEMAADFSPDLMLLDFHMPQHGGLHCLQAFASKFPFITRVVITGDERQEVFAFARAHGASGLISKALPIDQILRAIRTIGAGHEWWQERHASAAVSSPAAYANRSGSMFTLRQLEVLRLLGNGMNNRDIADTLSISERTVKQHVSDMLAKAEARNRVQLLSTARSQGLLA